jgi:hypothetical protein
MIKFSEIIENQLRNLMQVPNSQPVPQIQTRSINKQRIKFWVFGDKNLRVRGLCYKNQMDTASRHWNGRVTVM